MLSHVVLGIRRTAIDATKIAAVSHRDTQIGYLTSEFICERHSVLGQVPNSLGRKQAGMRHSGQYTARAHLFPTSPKHRDRYVLFLAVAACRQLYAWSDVVKLRANADLRSGCGRRRLFAGTVAGAPGTHRVVRRPRSRTRAKISRQEERDKGRRDKRAKAMVNRSRGSRLQSDRQRLSCGIQRNYSSRCIASARTLSRFDFPSDAQPFQTRAIAIQQTLRGEKPGGIDLHRRSSRFN